METQTIESLVNLQGYGDILSKVDSKSVLGLQQISEYVYTKYSVMEYQENILGYATEWEQVVTKRVDQELKNVKELQRTRSHYEIKVERLRNRVNTLENKGKDVPEGLGEKLVRNEGKLQESFKKHEREAGKLCILIEFVTQCGWQELQQLIENTLQWEIDRLSRENAVYNQRNIASMLEGMKQEAIDK